MTTEALALATLAAEVVDRRTDIDPRARISLLRDLTHPQARPQQFAAAAEDIPLLLAALVVAVSDAGLAAAATPRGRGGKKGDQRQRAGSRQRGLRPSSLRLLSRLICQMTPGEVWTGSPAVIGADMGRRTIVRATSELEAAGHLARMRSRAHRRLGWILPAVEAALPPSRRATPDGPQLRLPMLVAIATSPLIVRDLLAPAARPAPADRQAQPGPDLAVRARDPAQPGPDLVPNRPRLGLSAPAARPAPADRQAQPGPDLAVRARDPAQPGPDLVPNRPRLGLSAPVSSTRARDPDPDNNNSDPVVAAAPARADGLLSACAVRARHAGARFDEPAHRDRLRAGEIDVEDLQVLADQLAEVLDGPRRQVGVGVVAAPSPPPPPPPTNVWTEILGRIESRVTRHHFATWFSQTVFVEDTGDRLTVRVPHPLCRDWLTAHYAGIIAAAAADVTGRPVDVDLVL